MEFKKLFGNSRSNIGILSITVIILVFSIATTVYIAMFSWSVPDGISRLKVLALLSITAHASIAIGGVLGFLFGIPRTNSETHNKNIEIDTANADVSKNAKHKNRLGRYKDNTNLEVVSDWFTKMLVGIGLAQLHNIATFLKNISNYFATGIEVKGMQSMVTGILLFYFVLGFIGIYLITRLYLSWAIVEANLDASQKDIYLNIGEVNKNKK